MDERQAHGGIPADTEADGGHGLTAGVLEHDGATRAALPVVGIGASAGGLEVFKRLLENLQSTPRTARFRPPEGLPESGPCSSTPAVRPVPASASVSAGIPPVRLPLVQK